MLAIDGPSDIIRAPSGTLAAIQRPAARPPGTPPEPARNVDACEGCTRSQAGTERLTITTAQAAGIPHRASATRDGVALKGTVGRQLARNRPASSATAGATGSRYWKPLTGKSWKKATVTTIHESSSVSRHDASLRRTQRPAPAAATTASPI